MKRLILLCVVTMLAVMTYAQPAVENPDDGFNDGGGVCKACLTWSVNTIYPGGGYSGEWEHHAECVPGNETSTPGDRYRNCRVESYPSGSSSTGQYCVMSTVCGPTSGGGGGGGWLRGDDAADEVEGAKIVLFFRDSGLMTREDLAEFVGDLYDSGADAGMRLGSYRAKFLSLTGRPLAEGQVPVMPTARTARDVIRQE